jgi:hypothetical protein
MRTQDGPRMLKGVNFPMIRTDVGTFDWRAVALLIILNVLLGLTDVRADTFGTAPNEFGLEFVLIGAPGNPADDTSYGAVPYSYRIGKHEVSERMIEGFNDNGGQPSLNRAGWGVRVSGYYDELESGCTFCQLDQHE